MAFDASNLSVLAYANNFTLWHYTSVDNAATITGSGYFNKASDMVRVNDLILTNIDTDGTPSTEFYIVTGNSSGAVTIAAYSS
jgi:hypothetical protein